MTVGGALKAALRQTYAQSWRLVVLNFALATVAFVVLYIASYTTTALILFVAVGPFAAALMHCAVTVQQTDELHLRDGLAGLRLHWRRGLALGALVTIVVVLVVISISFYADRAWPVAILALYVAFLFGVWQIHLWPVAVARRGDRLAEVARETAGALVRRPFASTALALALLLVNVVGAIGILPVLTITVAFSAIAAAHFALPPPPEEAQT
jgi:energy-converting hydrogenase Eha subunit E